MLGTLIGVAGFAALFALYGILAILTGRDQGDCDSCTLGAGGICRTGSLLMRPGRAVDRDNHSSRTPSRPRPAG